MIDRERVGDGILYSQLPDGLLEKMSETKAEKIIAQFLKQEKAAA